MDDGQQAALDPVRPRRRSGGRWVLVGLLAVLSICAGICGISQLLTNGADRGAKDAWAGRGQPVPASSLPASPKPAWPDAALSGSVMDAKIRYDLEQQVLSSADPDHADRLRRAPHAHRGAVGGRASQPLLSDDG